jgi:hypothetical protein
VRSALISPDRSRLMGVPSIHASGGKPVWLHAVPDFVAAKINGAAAADRPAARDDEQLIGARILKELLRRDQPAPNLVAFVMICSQVRTPQRRPLLPLPTA